MKRGQGSKLLCIPTVPRAKRPRANDRANSALSRMLAHGGVPKNKRLEVCGGGGLAEQPPPVAVRSVTAPNLLTSRGREPLSTLEQYVVETATRYNTIVESAWWQSQCYLV
eukprot:SAG11_NODE_1261_length_5356_cov_12.941221_1_plen_111_part_00